jgi:flagellar biosynthetic protein FlhB
VALEKTEKATPKRREDARKKGQIARGPDLPAALGLVGALVALKFIVSDLNISFGTAVKAAADRITHTSELGTAELMMMLTGGAKLLALLSLPVLGVAFAAVAAGNFVQGGFSLTPGAFKPKTERFNPAANLKRIFGPDALFGLAKALVKLLIIALVAYGVVVPLFEGASTLLNASLPTVASELGSVLFTLAIRCGFVLVLLAAADYAYAYYKNEKSLKMTKQEVRDEFKEQEGDPLIKGQRRRSARILAMRRSIAAVPTATVVVTNPTHFAVALRYDRDKDAAPIVVAKGADNLAAKIRSVAAEHDIPLIENPPLARALYASVEPKQIIPAEFFGAVAEVLAYVFRINDERRA